MKKLTFPSFIALLATLAFVPAASSQELSTHPDSSPAAASRSGPLAPPGASAIQADAIELMGFVADLAPAFPQTNAILFHLGVLVESLTAGESVFGLVQALNGQAYAEPYLLQPALSRYVAADVQIVYDATGQIAADLAALLGIEL